MNRLVNVLLNVAVLAGLILGILIWLHESRPEPEFGLYRIEKMEGSAARVSRYEAELPNLFTEGIWKDGYDPNYRFVAYPIAFRFDQVKGGLVGGYVLKDSHPGDSWQRNITTFPPDKFDYARFHWEAYRIPKKLK